MRNMRQRRTQCSTRTAEFLSKLTCSEMQTAFFHGIGSAWVFDDGIHAEHTEKI